MSEVIEVIKWRIFKRFTMMTSVNGFYSHPLTYSCNKSIFEEFSQIKKNGVVKNSKIGRFTQIIGATVNNADVGSFTSIAPRTFVGGGGEHPLNQVSTHSIFYKACKYQYPKITFTDYEKFDDKLKKVKIGHDVWIGSDCIIKPGVEIGTGAVIATGSVVVKDIPCYAIYGGCPAKLIRYRHDDELIEALLNSQWWNWTIPKLKVIAKHFDQSEALTVSKLKLILDEVSML